MGAQDDLGQAQDFLNSVVPGAPGLANLSMIWDGSFSSWQQLGITGQPAYILYDASGQTVGSGFGRVPQNTLDAVL